MDFENKPELHSDAEQLPSTPKHHYQPPVLSLYGKIDRLTKGGSGTQKEGKKNELNKKP